MMTDLNLLSSTGPGNLQKYLNLENKFPGPGKFQEFVNYLKSPGKVQEF